MKILLTGATGYIGKRLLPFLVKEGFEVVCCVRDKLRFHVPNSLKQSVEVIEIDLLKKESLKKIPKDIEGAYYLVHSMSTDIQYQKLEIRCAINFRECLLGTQVKHLIYLSGIVNENQLSKHLSSRKNVEEELSKGNYNFTALRAGIIVGSGSASFEIMRDLVEKLPIMVTPKWLHTKCQPIAIRNVLQILSKSIFNKETYNKNFDIGGEDILSYKQMLLDFANVRGLKRSIFILPVMTPKLSSYWLYFITSTSYKLAIALVESMKVNVVCRDLRILDILNIKPISYKKSIEMAFNKIKHDDIISSWKDSYISSGNRLFVSDFVEVPDFGCFKDLKVRKIHNKCKCVEKIWSIGGDTGWYYANFLWKIRGFFDLLVGGVGLRRGRTHIHKIDVGDALDFWRVLYADKKEGRLLLFAEMKLPGEAWLEFNIKDNILYQTATFRPLGLLGRMYWYAVLPFHGIIFNGMINRLSR